MKPAGDGKDEMGVESRKVERQFEIVNKLGLHARAAAKLVRLANGFSSEIRLEREGVEVNGKSIMGVLMLAAHKESLVSVSAEGPDACEAVDAIGGLIAEKFEEKE
jgi:phosphocarrier protein HPr